jgi:hypothetical protein
MTRYSDWTENCDECDEPLTAITGAITRGSGRKNLLLCEDCASMKVSSDTLESIGQAVNDTANHLLHATETRDAIKTRLLEAEAAVSAYTEKLTRLRNDLQSLQKAE